ncbi:type II toxin-antitoxin system Phd/YefM family antitoxin [Legionella beliardensis]|nr:type II toxin-antitoxin system Phd/YefM family antitoxin [Legionella beliardensis]
MSNKMTATVLKVGMREFRAHLQQYILTSSPVAITRHGETVGYYIPTKSHAEKSDLHDLKEAAAKLDKLLIEHGISENELFADFRKLKSKNRK